MIKIIQFMCEQRYELLRILHFKTPLNEILNINNQLVI